MYKAAVDLDGVRVQASIYLLRETIHGRSALMCQRDMIEWVEVPEGAEIPRALVIGTELALELYKALGRVFNDPNEVAFAKRYSEHLRTDYLAERDRTDKLIDLVDRLVTDD